VILLCLFPLEPEYHKTPMNATTEDYYSLVDKFVLIIITLESNAHHKRKVVVCVLEKSIELM